MTKPFEIDLQEIPNPGCKVGCNRKERKHFAEDELCTLTTSALDGLQIRCVGEWAHQKITYLTKYFNIFSIGMKNQWDNINYVEICSGPGRCVVRQNGKEIDGTALSIIKQKAFEHIESALFIDNNPQVVTTLNTRIEHLSKQKIAKSIVGDYYEPESIAKVLSSLPQRALNLVFVDPTDCSFPFRTIEAINSILKNVDFIINVFIGNDVNRNVKAAIFGHDDLPSRVKYSDFLGGDTYFNSERVLELARRNENQELRQLFREEYMNSLKRLGYSHFGTERVKHYYELLFASKHPRGLQFWQKANRIQPDRQYKLDFFG